MKTKSKNLLVKTAIIIGAGILDFLINYILALKCQVPLFLDTTFTMAILFTFGPMEAILSYFTKTILSLCRTFLVYKIMDFQFLYFFSIVIVIITTWLFVRKSERLQVSVNRSFLYLLITAATSAAICSVTSGLISFFTYDKNIEAWAYDKIIFSFRFGKTGLLGTHILGRYPITVLDRVITTFAGFGIYYLWNKKIHEKSI